MNDSITLDSRMKQSEGHLVTDVDGDKVLLNVSSSVYYNLGGIGGDIWTHVGTGSVVSQVVNRLMSDYAVEQAECEQRVLIFLEQMRQEGLITICE